MFKIAEQTPEQRESFDNQRAQESLREQAREEIHRRRQCIEYAVQLEETRPENLFDLADKIYNYIYGASE